MMQMTEKDNMKCKNKFKTSSYLYFSYDVDEQNVRLQCFHWKFTFVFVRQPLYVDWISNLLPVNQKGD